MAAYVPVPRDVTRVKTKVFLNLTMRQIVSFAAAAAAGLPVYFLLKGTGNVSLAALAMVTVMMPFIFIGLYEREGETAEKILWRFIDTKFRRPGIRPYRTDNSYARFMRLMEAEREVRKIVFDHRDTEKPARKGR